MRIAGQRERYKYIRQIEEDLDKFYYELNGLEFWEKIASAQNLGNQRFNKARLVLV